MRAIGLDVHRDFCEVAILAEGRLRSPGRIQTRPETLELFAFMEAAHESKRTKGAAVRIDDVLKKVRK